MKYEKGSIVIGTVTGIESYGIFVSLDEFYSGLIHISEISNGYVRNINNFVKVGEMIFVKVIDVDNKLNHLTLSIKDINYKVMDNHVKRKIKETTLGFKTLQYNLPLWIKKSLKKQEKTIKSIDK
ncbi:MAG: S1 RNA-binding domain-containing protein [Clostridium sp.]|nr:S1 RNA-binding domain-containing protein [Clostridium sp.]MCM1443886.1 S1 RNA-binding domain-containing protein [Candidatus Amulumruptor caecigallinarius]